MRIQSYAFLATAAVANFQRHLEEAHDQSGHEIDFYARTLEQKDLIDFQKTLLTGGLGFNALPQIMTYINHSPEEAGIIEFLMVSDFLIGIDMEEDGLYMSYFQYPSARSPGIYDSYTCTSKFSRQDEISTFYKVLYYEGTELFSEGRDQSGPYDKFKSSEQEPKQAQEYEGWNVFFDKRVYVNEADSSGVNVRSCSAIRAISASGFPRTDTAEKAPEELVWVDGFKYQHTYKIRSGWRLWENISAENPIDGDDVLNDWKLEIDCGDYGCIGSGSVSLAASALALTAVLFAY